MSRLLLIRVGITCSLAFPLLACGGGQSKKANTDPANHAPAQPLPEPENPQQKFARQQADTVDKMCQRLIACSLKDAMANGSPEEIAQLEKDRAGITVKAIADCSDSYAEHPMSPRQVVGIRACLSAATECPVFLECLGAATAPKAKTAAASGKSE